MKDLPEKICRAALTSVGVPQYIVDDIRPGRLMDMWVHLVVMNNVPWQQVQAKVERATEMVLGELKSDEGQK
jgi:hypothetical protein